MKHKAVLDKNADGNQWVYRNMGIQKQIHPKLLPYACYDWQRNDFLIGVSTTISGAKELIDNYISDGSNWTTYIVLMK